MHLQIHCSSSLYMHGSCMTCKHYMIEAFPCSGNIYLVILISRNFRQISSLFLEIGIWKKLMLYNVIFVAIETCRTNSGNRILLVHLTCVQFEFYRWYFDDLRQTLDKIVNFIDFVYQNDTKYIILPDSDSFRYWTLEILTIFFLFIALILIACTCRNMDIHVSEQGHIDKCTCRNRVFCCWWSIAKKTDISLFDAKFLADWNTHNWTNGTFRNRVHNSSSNIHHRVCSPSVV